MDKEKFIKLVIEMDHIRKEFSVMGVIPEDLEDVLTELVFGIFPSKFNEEFPQEKFK